MCSHIINVKHRTPIILVKCVVFCIISKTKYEHILKFQSGNINTRNRNSIQFV